MENRMRYQKTFDEAMKKLKTDNERRQLEKLWTEINARCDSYNQYIYNENPVTLLKKITSYWEKWEMEASSTFPPQTALELTITEILRERTRKRHIAGSTQEDDTKEMFAVFFDLAFSRDNLLDAIASKEATGLQILKNGNISVKYREGILKLNEDINKKQAFLYDTVAYDVYRCPWLAFEGDKLEEYAEKNRALHTFFRFFATCGKKYLEMNIWGKHALEGSLLPHISAWREMKEEQGLLIWRGMNPFLDDYFFSKLKGSFKHWPLMCVGLDDQNLPEEEIDITKKPVLTTQCNGRKEFIIIPHLIGENMQYAETVYENTLPKDAKEQTVVARAISTRMEEGIKIKILHGRGERVIDAFSGKAGTLAYKNQEKTRKIEVDCLVIDTLDKVGLLIEYKHTMSFRRTAQMASRMKNTFSGDARRDKKKGAGQIQEQIEFFNDHKEEIERDLNLPRNLLSEIALYPLIVSNTLEHDHVEFPFSKKVFFNGQALEGVKKISYVELQQLTVASGNTLAEIITTIQNDTYWDEKLLWHQKKMELERKMLKKYQQGGIEAFFTDKVTIVRD